MKRGLALLFLWVAVLLVSIISWLGNPAPAQARSLTTPSATLLSTASSGGKPLFSFAGTRPTNLGIKDGKLTACPTSPNCVNSQTDTSDQEHSISPLEYTSSPATAIAQLKSVITGMERTKIIEETESYLYAEFTSTLMGFVDDVEFYVVPEEKVIHVRSASRLGQSDLGVNRKRIEAIRTAFNAAESKV